MNKILTNNLLKKSQDQKEIKITPGPFGAMDSNLSNILFEPRVFI